MGDSFIAASVEQIQWGSGGLSTSSGIGEVIERSLERPAGAPTSLDDAKLSARASGAGGARFSSLYEALNAKREAADADAKERERTRFRPVGLDEEDAAFLAVQAADAVLAVRATASQAGADRAAFEEAIAQAHEGRVRDDGERRKRSAAAALGAGGGGGGNTTIAHKRHRVGEEEGEEEDNESVTVLDSTKKTVVDNTKVEQKNKQEAAELAAVNRAAAASRARESATSSTKGGASLPPPSFLVKQTILPKMTSATALPPTNITTTTATASTATAIASLVDYESDSN
jgi:hypothetical protein